MDERQVRVISCLNAAVNLYGVVSFAEAMKLYNRYSADKPTPLGGLLTEEEIDTVLALPPPDDFDLDDAERWFVPCEIDGTRYLVAEYGFCTESDEEEKSVDKVGVRCMLESCLVPDLKILPENDFFIYDEPKCFEETGVTRRFAKFLRQEYGYKKMEAELAVWDVQEELRYDASVRGALISARNTLGLAVHDRDEFEDLVDALLPLVRNTRTWDYRGHTQTELVNMGVLKEFPPVDGEEIFGWFMEDNEGNRGDSEGFDDEESDDDWEPDAWDTGHLSDDDLASILPPAALTGPIDFKKAKDADWREQILDDYHNMRNVTADFVRGTLMKELKPKERKAAAKRLGFGLGGAPSHEKANLDMVAGDFAAMMDDQSGEPPIRRVLKRLDKLPKYEQLGAAYYANYRYAWLVVEAVKSGFGLKCHDLLSGEDLFLVETSMSLSPQVKGMTLCAGIAPFGEVYCALGVISHADFEPSAAVHRVVRQHLGLPLDGPLTLSFADQARFAAEAIRRIHALGRYANVFYGES